MKKLLVLTLIIFVNDCLSMIDNRSGTNAEYVYFNGTNPVTNTTMQNEIYQITSTYQFPMNTNPSNAPAISALSVSDREAMYMRELGFISDKIRKTYPEVHILPIPKSLYQLFVLREFIAGVTSGIKTGYYPRCQGKGALFEDASFTAKTIMKHANESNPLSAACASYMSDEKVKDFFWTINGRISEFLKGFCASDRLNESQLLDICNRLQCDLKLPSLIPEILSCFANILLMRSVLYKKLCSVEQEWEKSYRISLNHTIWNLLREEFLTIENESLRGTCRIYRGGSLNHIGKSAISFSNGWFGGVINDSDSGMAFEYILRGHNICSVDVDKRGGQAVFIPQISILGATLGGNEFHHPRVKVSKMYYLEPGKSIVGIYGIGRGISDTHEILHELVDDSDNQEVNVAKLLKRVTTRTDAEAAALIALKKD